MRNYELEDIVDAIKSKDKDRINEASLGRAYQHVQQEASDSFAIITAYRGGYSKSENRQRNKQLESDVRSLGLGFFKVKGYWMECQDPGMEYDECSEDMKEPVVEVSLFIPNIEMEDAIKLGRKYDQDAIIFQGEETNDDVQLIDKRGRTIADLGKFSPNKIKRAYTKIKGKSFTFEGFEYQPQGQLEGLVFEALLDR